MAALREFQATIKADPFTELADLIPSGPEPVIYTDLAGNSKQKPLTFDRLKEFVAEFDVRRFGLKRTDTLCTAIPNGPEACVCFWAVSSQCVFAPLNPNLTIPEVEFELEDLPCHTMLVLRETNPDMPAVVEKTKQVTLCCGRFNVPVVEILRDPSWAGLFRLDGKAVPTPVPAVPTLGDDLALVLHTSGTTKKPKIVPLTHSNLGNGIQFVARTLTRKREDVCLNVMPLFHIHGIVANVGVSVFLHSQVAARFRRIATPCLATCLASAILIRLSLRPARRAHPLLHDSASKP